MIIDSHCHLDYAKLFDQLDDVVERANLNKVKYLLTICTTLESFAKIKLIIEKQKYNFLVSMDSRSYTFRGEQEFIIKKSNFNINLIQPNNFDFFETLRKKLNWGLDIRN